MSDIFIYWGSGSVPCWMPMIVLEEKGISNYGHKLITFSEKEHKGDEIKKLNPRGQVPTFRHGDIVLNESKGICHYLENQFKKQGSQLIPDDAAQQALVLQRMYETENIAKKALMGIMYYLMTTKKEDVSEALLEERKKAVAEELQFWESYLTKDYLAGDAFTMADVFFGPLLCVLVRGSLSLDNRPNLKRYYARFSNRDSVKATWPPHYKNSDKTSLFAGV